MSNLPNIVTVFTGGTIASTLDQEFGGVVPNMTGGQIMAHIPDVDEIANIIIHEFGTFPGPHMSPGHMLELSRVVQRYVDEDEIQGIVITHGTDTLEETAYFLDSTVATEKPIVVVGSMRNSSEPDWDGPRNLRDAISAASHPATHGLGVMVTLSGEVLAASEATKVDTADVATFASPNFGPLGRIANRHVLIHRRPLHREIFDIAELPSFVPLFKSYAGQDATLIEAALSAGAQGMVIEAFGVGNVTPSVYHALKKVVYQGVPVVLVSRCPVGRVEHVYAYEGAGRHLHDSGVIFADFLNGPKARIKLICALGSGCSMDEVRACFEWVDDSVTGLL